MEKSCAVSGTIAGVGCLHQEKIKADNMGERKGDMAISPTETLSFLLLMLSREYLKDCHTRRRGRNSSGVV